MHVGLSARNRTQQTIFDYKYKVIIPAREEWTVGPRSPPVLNQRAWYTVHMGPGCGGWGWERVWLKSLSDPSEGQI
jgi:hypothetical protein